MEAGVPAGVLQVVTGSASEIGAELTSNPRVRKLTFTGSTEVGRVLMAQCAPTLKKLSLELGGNAPFIVFDDADLDAAVEGAIAAKFRNAGQTCVCANRLYVQEGVHDVFVERLAARIAGLRVGAGLADGTEQGPLIDGAAIEKVEEHVRDALTNGARLVIGGKRMASGGEYFQPTLLADATQQMLIAQEETFGPVAAVFRFRDEEHVISLANATDLGLASYFYTRRLSRAWRVAEALECGMVGINTGLISTEVAPFGGVKQSGFGREGSRYGAEDYVELKYLCMAV
jgi:succinate-semialdehyde dehydrogenase/glutarate-semialdehyde dehydrogenase